MGDSLRGPGGHEGNPPPIGNKVDHAVTLLRTLCEAWFKPCLAEEGHLGIVDVWSEGSRPPDPFLLIEGGKRNALLTSLRMRDGQGEDPVSPRETFLLETSYWWSLGDEGPIDLPLGECRQLRTLCGG